jgi:hypothetical protein
MQLRTFLEHFAPRMVHHRNSAPSRRQSARGGGGDFSKHLEQANWSNDMTAALSREVQITKDEVLLQLPDAIEGRPFTVENGEIIVDATDNGRVRIVLTDKGDVEMGAT